MARVLSSLTPPCVGSLRGLASPVFPSSSRYCPRPVAGRSPLPFTRAAADVAAGMPGQDKDDVKGDMLAPSIVNKQWFRAVVVAGTVAATAGSANVLPSQGANFLHLLSYGLLFGANIWNSFFVGFTMFKNMPRQTFGRVQSKLFPQYFTLTSAANAVLLASLYVSGVPPSSPPFIALAVAAAGSAVNWLWLEPKTTGLMFERYAIENKPQRTEADEADIKRLYKQFGMWHGISALANLVVLAATTAYGWQLAGRLAL